jgi:hypothetical protein
VYKFSVVCAYSTSKMNWLSRLIMRVQGSTFSHVAIECTEAFTNKRTYFHSKWPVGHSLNEAEWNHTYKITARYELPDGDAKQQLFWLADRVRVPYALLQLIYIWIYRACTDLRPLMIRHLINGNSAMICAEFVYSFLSTFHGAHTYKTDDLVDLEDIVEMCEALTKER